MRAWDFRWAFSVKIKLHGQTMSSVFPGTRGSTGTRGGGQTTFAKFLPGDLGRLEESVGGGEEGCVEQLWVKEVPLGRCEGDGCGHLLCTWVEGRQSERAFACTVYCMCK